MVRLRALDRKLLRDLWRLKGQALAIAAVIASGIALFVLMLSTFQSLDLTKRIYYERYRFADVFDSLKRAPLWVADEIADIPGVAQVQTRVVVDVTVDMADMTQPVTGRLVSIPSERQPVLDRLFLRRGRWIEPGRDDEILVSHRFAAAHELQPGSTLAAVINGRKRTLTVVGIAQSPEYVYSIRPGALFPDDALYGVMWMGRRPLAYAFDMDGAFNDVVLSLEHGALTEEVISRLDRLLRPYGGLGAIPRSQQISDFYLESELSGLRAMGAIVPVVFLGVAAFLLNVVLSRLVTMQRQQIAAMKALGYGSAQVGWHYVKWSLIIAGVGAVVGVAAGAWLGSEMTQMYTRFFSFPILRYHLASSVVVQALAVCLAAAVLGPVAAVRRAVRLPPAEAMRPQPPTVYRQSLLERIGLGRVLSQPSRILLRNLQRRPGRTALSVVGIACGGAIMIVGTFTIDAMAAMNQVHFFVAQRYDVMVSFTEPRSHRALSEVRHLPGVVAGEGFRAVPARLRFGPRHRNVTITGLDPSSPMYRVVDDRARKVVVLPPSGLVLNDELAGLLGVQRGDAVTVEVLEGRRPVRRVVVQDVVVQYLGTTAYMSIDALHRLIDEGGTLSGAYLQVDADSSDRLFQRLKNLPAVAGVMIKHAAVESFRRTLGETIGKVRVVMIVFAAIIAFGVVYNTARISLSERARELATLRVIGFWRSEIAYILLGELAVVAVVAVPLGMLLGYGLAGATAGAYHTEVYRLPLIVLPRTFALAAITVLAATTISALVVRRRLQRLDLIAVLKTRE